MTESPQVPDVAVLEEAPGVQHAGRDEYYYRPLISGDGLFTYVAHVPPGGDMPADQEEAELFELSLFMIEGELEVSLAGTTRVLRAGEAQHIPRRVAFGCRNDGDSTASFVLSFTPNPSEGGIGDMFQRMREKGAKVWEPVELNSIRAARRVVEAGGGEN